MTKEVRCIETEKYVFSAEEKLERELDSEDIRFESRLKFLALSASISSAVKMNTGVLP